MTPTFCARSKMFGALGSLYDKYRDRLAMTPEVSLAVDVGVLAVVFAVGRWWSAGTCSCPCPVY